MTLYLTTSLLSLCVVYCVSASFSFIKANLVPPSIAPTMPPSSLPLSIRHSVGVNGEPSPDRHQESHQTPVGPSSTETQTVASSDTQRQQLTVHSMFTDTIACIHTRNIATQSHVIVETLSQMFSQGCSQTIK